MKENKQTKTNIWRECCTSITNNMSPFRKGCSLALPTTTESTCIWKSLVICLQKSAQEKKKTAVSFLNLQHRMKLYIYIYLYLYTFFVYHLFSVLLLKRGSERRECPLAIWTTLALVWRSSLHNIGVGTLSILHHLHLEYLQNKKVNKNVFYTPLNIVLFDLKSRRGREKCN